MLGAHYALNTIDNGNVFYFLDRRPEMCLPSRLEQISFIYPNDQNFIISEYVGPAQVCLIRCTLTQKKLSDRGGYHSPGNTPEGKKRQEQANQKDRRTVPQHKPEIGGHKGALTRNKMWNITVC